MDKETTFFAITLAILMAIVFFRYSYQLERIEKLRGTESFNGPVPTQRNR